MHVYTIQTTIVVYKHANIEREVFFKKAKTGFATARNKKYGANNKNCDR